MKTSTKNKLDKDTFVRKMQKMDRELQLLYARRNMIQECIEEKEAEIQKFLDESIVV